MNNNKSDENAILAGCKGVFAKTSYITIGTKEKPELYTTQDKDRSNYNGKQFFTNPAKVGKTLDTYFEKKHNWVSDGDKYVDRLFYAETQKDKKKGFLTGDYKRRDEYSNVFRTQQYREQLGSEAKFQKQALQLIAGEGEQEGQGSMQRSKTMGKQEGTDKPFLFDLVYGPEDKAAVDKQLKVSRDTLNPTRLTKERDQGTMRTTSQIAHGPPTDFTKPQYARRPIVRDTFYRKTNIFFPSNCAATSVSD